MDGSLCHVTISASSDDGDLTTLSRLGTVPSAVSETHRDQANFVQVRVSFDVTRKGERSLVIDGYKFTKSRDGLGERVFWRCSRRECKATAVTVADHVDHIRAVHSHEPPLATEFYANSSSQSVQHVKFNSASLPQRSRASQRGQLKNSPTRMQQPDEVMESGNDSLENQNWLSSQSHHSRAASPGHFEQISPDGVPQCSFTGDLASDTLSAILNRLVGSSSNVKPSGGTAEGSNNLEHLPAFTPLTVVIDSPMPMKPPVQFPNGADSDYQKCDESPNVPRPFANGQVNQCSASSLEHLAAIATSFVDGSLGCVGEVKGLGPVTTSTKAKAVDNTHTSENYSECCMQAFSSARRRLFIPPSTEHSDSCLPIEQRRREISDRSVATSGTVSWARLQDHDGTVYTTVPTDIPISSTTQFEAPFERKSMLTHSFSIYRSMFPHECPTDDFNSNGVGSMCVENGSTRHSCPIVTSPYLKANSSSDPRFLEPDAELTSSSPDVHEPSSVEQSHHINSLNVSDPRCQTDAYLCDPANPDESNTGLPPSNIVTHWKKDKMRALVNGACTQELRCSNGRSRDLYRRPPAMSSAAVEMSCVRERKRCAGDDILDEDEIMDLCTRVQDDVLLKVLSTIQQLTARLNGDADPPEVIQNCRAIQACLDTVATIKRLRYTPPVEDNCNSTRRSGVPAFGFCDTSVAKYWLS